MQHYRNLGQKLPLNECCADTKDNVRLNKNQSRRTLLNKFSNRPPFDLKKDECSSDSIRKEKSFKNNRIYNVIRPNESVIPKVIESFKKVTPKGETEESSADSVRTLYRNESSNFGKHIPDHKLMKNLLQNFQPEKKKKEKVAYQIVDVVPSKDTNKTCKMFVKKSSKGNKVDKATSTGSLLAKSIYRPLEKDARPKSKIPLRKRIDITIETFDDDQKVDKPQDCKLSTKEGTFVIDGKRSNGKVDYREKTFVQEQVHRLDEFYQKKGICCGRKRCGY